ncbi:MAG: hypothetical protein KDK12_20795 [Rhodobacteraceae bacterium]|nr:hypothetical protein [Paracoccaceae bacterium]
MSNTMQKPVTLNSIDLVTIEQQARAMQAQALAEMFRALWRAIAGLFARTGAARTA